MAWMTSSCSGAMTDWTIHPLRPSGSNCEARLRRLEESQSIIGFNLSELKRELRDLQFVLTSEGGVQESKRFQQERDVFECFQETQLESQAEFHRLFDQQKVDQRNAVKEMFLSMGKAIKVDFQKAQEEQAAIRLSLEHTVARHTEEYDTTRKSLFQTAEEFAEISSEHRAQKFALECCLRNAGSDPIEAAQHVLVRKTPSFDESQGTFVAIQTDTIVPVENAAKMHDEIKNNTDQSLREQLSMVIGEHREESVFAQYDGTGLEGRRTNSSEVHRGTGSANLENVETQPSARDLDMDQGDKSQGSV